MILYLQTVAQLDVAIIEDIYRLNNAGSLTQSTSSAAVASASSANLTFIAW